MLYGALRFSDHPRARILRIDTSRAEAHPGVVSVLTAADVPGERTQGTLTKDWRQLVAEGETTAYVGDVLAAVAAESRHAAREAAALVDVEYEVLDPVTDPFEAMDAGRAAAARERQRALRLARAARRRRRRARGCGARRGRRPTARSASSTRSSSPSPPSSSRTDDGGFQVYSQGQGVWEDRRQIASFLGLSEEQVRVTQVSTGGAFGAKEDLNVQAHAALLATDDRAARAPHAHPAREPALPLEAPSDVAHVHRSAATTTGASSRCALASSATPGPTPASATRCSSVPPGTPAAPTRCRTWTSRRRPSTRTTRPAGRCAASGSTSRTSPSRACSTRSRSAVGIDGWEIRWRNALDVGDTLRHRAGARARGRPQEDAPGGA